MIPHPAITTDVNIREQAAPRSAHETTRGRSDPASQVVYGYLEFVEHKLCDVVVNSVDPELLGRFWSELIEQPVADIVGSQVALKMCDHVGLVFVPTDHAKLGKNRLHLDLASTSVEHQAAVVERACSLGAQQVDIGQGSVPWVVLADPEGNEFCVLEPRDEYMTTGPVAAVVVDAADPFALARFWSDVTGLPITRAHPEYASLARERGFWLEFVRVVEPKSTKNRLHVHLIMNPSTDLLEDVNHLVEIQGATRAGTDECRLQVRHSVRLADPERNHFCVVAPRLRLDS
jgi:hypothetical protein